MAKGKSLKIVVGYPPTLSSKGTPLLSQNRQFQYFNNPTFLFPVSLATGATWLRNEGWETHWKDCIAEGVNEEEFYSFLDEVKPDLFFFETKSPVVKKHWRAVGILKDRYPKMKICMMGDHLSAFPEETMKKSKLDFLICGGYYDFAMVELADALENNKEIPRGIWYRKGKKIVENGRYELKKPLDVAPIVDRKFTRNELYQKEFNLIGRPLAYIMSARDCWWGRCTFCFTPETLVMTKDGTKQIKDITLNDEVITHSGKYQKPDFIFQRDYSGELIKIKVDGIPELRCTPNHRIYVKKNNEEQTIAAADLKEGDLVISLFNQQAHNILTKNDQNTVQLHRLSSEKSFLPIKNISHEEYFGPVYNISVPREHSYTANLLNVSNCVWDHTLYPKGTFRARSPENVMQEVKYLVDECGVQEIFDDAGTITVGPWLKKFCDLMIESGYNKKVIYSCNMRFGAVNAEEYKHMARAGFRLLKYGLESGCQKTIDKLDKGTRIADVVSSCRDAKKAGLTVHLTMMVGYPWEYKQDAIETIKLSRYLMRKGHADVLQSTIIVPYPGTPLWKEGIEKGWFRNGMDPYDYERFDMAEPVFTTPDMTPQEVESICKKIYYVFLHPEYVLRHLTKIRSFEDVLYTLKGVKAVAGHLKDFSRQVQE